jgi:sugar phosphate isomerase/epimerase
MAGLSINQMTTYRWSFDQDVARYKAAGIKAMGVWRQKLADYGEQRGIQLLRESGLQVSNLLWAGGFTGSDGHNYQESMADARTAMQLAAELQADCLVVYSGGRNGHTQNHARRLFAGALRELIPWAEELNVVLAVKPMHPGCAEDWTFLTSLDEAMSLVDGIGHSHVKLAFDTYHLGHDPKILEQIAPIAQYIAVVHLGDGSCPPKREQNRCCLGEGTLPWGPIVQALDRAGYDGHYDVELMGESVEQRDYCELLEKSKCAFQRMIAC